MVSTAKRAERKSAKAPSSNNISERVANVDTSRKSPNSAHSGSMAPPSRYSPCVSNI